MNEQNVGDTSANEMTPEQRLEEQARDQAGQQRIQVHVDEKSLKTSYANVFRPTVTAEELILDFGLNIMLPPRQGKAEREIVFQANNRIIMGYYAAKRLAIALGQVIRRYEQEFGELELNAAKRRSGQAR